jgi:nucleoside-diphosphate-sugar epimerase
MSTTSVANGWKYTIEFDSRHAGEVVIKVTKKPPLVSRDQVRTIAADVTVDNSRTKRELGYTPANLHEGLEKSVFWSQQSGYLAVRV